DEGKVIKKKLSIVAIPDPGITLWAGDYSIKKKFDLKNGVNAFELLEQKEYGDAVLLVGYYTYKWIIYPLYLSPL
ncbi:8062_t:CDS:2, partial [Diversispora eburnea]